MASRTSTDRREFRRIEVKRQSDGSFYGLLSPYNTVDTYGDIVEPGAYKKTIADNGGKIVMLWQHIDESPIGTLELKEEPDGLYVKGQILQSDAVPEARKAQALVDAEIVDGLSIGFKAVQKEMKDGNRHLKEIRLFEGSIVTFPAAGDARILEHRREQRDMNQGDFDEEYAELVACRAGYQMVQTLENCLMEAWWRLNYGGEDAAVLKDYVTTVIGQFQTAFTGAWDTYAGMMANGDEDDMRSMRLKEMAEYIERKAAGKTRRVDGEDLPSSAFLIVGDPQKTDTWKLPVHFSDDAKTKSHIRNALARIDQVQGVSADVLAKAKTRLQELAKQHGIDAGKSGDEVDREKKVGKAISAETKSVLMKTMDHVKSAHDFLSALVEDPAAEDDGTGNKSAADKESDEPEADPLDVELLNGLREVKGLFEVHKAA